MTGIRAEVVVDAAGACPVATASRAADAPTLSITRSVSPDGDGRVTEEFMLDGEHDGDLPALDPPVETVFDYGGKRVYRFERDLGWGCPCEAVEQFDCPVVDVHTDDGRLYLVFHARDMAQLQDVIASLRERYPTVDVRRLLRQTDDSRDQHLVFVDRGALTDRQLEVVETAHEMGYFDHPKGANAGEVADAIGISRSTFAEHLAAAQSKLLESILAH